MLNKLPCRSGKFYKLLFLFFFDRDKIASKCIMSEVISKLQPSLHSPNIKKEPNLEEADTNYFTQVASSQNAP